MSRAARRRSQGRSTGATLERPAAPDEAAAEPEEARSAAGRRYADTPPSERPYGGAMPPIRWRAVLVGLVLGQLILLVFTNGAIDLANYFLGGTGDRADGGIIGTASFLSVMAGGAIAARVGRCPGWREGSWQGIVVAIGFILVAIVFQLAQEASIVHDSLASGLRNLVDLGPMRIDQVITGDLLALFGGGVGGFLARGRER